MSIGLLALLDDVAGLVKLAASSVDDVASLAAKAGLKATGAVIDDAAVTPRYVAGFDPERELPIVGRIARGSIRNKLLFLLPAALALSLFLPGAITPLLMIGGAYLCYEGAEKVFEAVFPHEAHAHEASLTPVAIDPKTLEDEKVASAIKTDFILSAEIMTIALAALPPDNLWVQAISLLLVAIGITVLVYGGVALIVKADDFGLYLSQNASESAGGRFLRALGRGIVKAMPPLMTGLGIVGTAAMIWVGGGIVVHGFEEFGFHAPADLVHAISEAAAHAVPAIGGALHWLAESAAYGVFGLALGALLIPVASRVISPLWKAMKRLRPARAA